MTGIRAGKGTGAFLCIAALLLGGQRVHAQPADDGASAATAVAPAISPAMPIDPGTGLPFPTREELVERTPPGIRPLTEAETTERASWQALSSKFVREGQFAAATPLAERLLELEEATLGPDHPGLIATLSLLGTLNRKRSRLEQAMPFDERAFLIAAETLGEGHPDTIGYLKMLARDYAWTGLPEQAEQLDRKALALATAILGEKHPDRLTTLNNLAHDLSELGRHDEAERLDRVALDLRTQVLGESHPATVLSLGNLAEDLARLGRYDEAERLQRRALDLRRQVLGNEHPDTIANLSNLAAVVQSLGRPSEAEALFREAYEASAKVLGENDERTLVLLGNWSASLSDLGRHAEAAQLDRRIVEISMRDLGAGHPNTLVAINNLAVELAALGHFAEAEALHESSLEFLTDMRGASHPMTLSVASDLALDRLRQPERAAFALEPARLALSGRLARFSLLAGDSLRGGLQRDRERGTLQMSQRLFADAAWAAGHDAPLRVEAFAALQGALAGSAALAIAEVAARRYAAGAGAQALVAERKALGERWARVERQMTAGLGTSTPDVTLREELAALEARIAALDEEIASKAPQYAAIVTQPALSLEEAQGLLGPDEAVLMAVPGLFGTHVMALTREGLAWHQADIDADTVGEAVGHLRAQLDPSGQSRSTTLGSARTPNGQAFDRGAAWQLYETLVAPVAGSLAGKSHVYVAADGALSSLPFGVLVTQEPAAGSDDTAPAVLRETPWFADAHALVQIPSLQSLAWLRTYTAGSNRPRATVSFAGFGDPLLGGAATLRGSRSGSLPVTDASALTGPGTSDVGVPLMDPAALRRLARLPGTRAELEAMRATLGVPASALHMEAAMTETAIRTIDLSRTRILHLATHGLTASESGTRAEPGLVFTPPEKASNTDDGYLAASEVLALDLTSTEWVILSACNTAAPSGNPGEAGLSGLARAFFYAGAPSLLASHWPVDDTVAARLTVDTLARTKAPGITRAQALQSAIQAIRDDTAHPHWAHPAAWAPFSLLGEGR